MSELTAAVERLSTSEGLVVVLDLDATVWLPEVYTLRAPRGTADGWTPTLGTDVRVLPGAAAVLRQGLRAGRWRRAQECQCQWRRRHQMPAAPCRRPHGSSGWCR